ncbi:MAG: HD domain-containing phosphohydrolase, partial [bacterium]
AHCTDMSVILQECYVDILERGGRKPSQANRRFALIAGFMHDIGKSEVPKDILESTDRFSPDSQEMILMRNHTTYGSRILSDMGMPKITINVAHYHHVKTESTLLTSYPKVSYEEVLPLTRLASITDVYQALIGKRRYKKTWVPGKAIEYLIKLEGSEFDARVLKQFIDSMGRYPLGSLVRLSTNTLAFVMEMAPIEHSDRPIVAVVENAEGELLSSHTLVDLMVEPDLSITEVVDHYEHFSQTEDQAFNIFKSIRVA